MGRKLSIITVNYNNKIGLQKTIDSVKQQTWQEFEYLIIDGASTDGSADLINRYKNEFTYCISEPDKGVYNAMNKGIRHATGDYIYFLNSGDVFSSNNVLEKIEIQLDSFYKIYYGDLLYKEKDGLFNWKNPEKLSFLFFLDRNINHQACFIKRNLFDEFFYYNEDYKIVSDWEFLVYAICKENVPYKHLQMTISIYDTTGISSNESNRAAMDADKAKTLNKFFPSFIGNYEGISQLQLKRVKQFLFIKKHKIAFKILKGFMNIILLFLPKFMNKPNDN